MPTPAAGRISIGEAPGFGQERKTATERAAEGKRIEGHKESGKGDG